MTWPPLALLGVVLVSVAGLNDHQSWPQTTEWMTTNLVRRMTNATKLDRRPPNFSVDHQSWTCAAKRPPIPCTVSSRLHLSPVWDMVKWLWAVCCSGITWMDGIRLARNRGQTEAGWSSNNCQSTAHSDTYNWGRLAHQCLTQLLCAPA